ncbi:MAG: site-specific integrase [Proteobacteria bacterium]|nr:site-specific integrase [Pseudomonadota bacterium]
MEKALQNAPKKNHRKSRLVQLRCLKMARETAMRGGEIWSLPLINIRMDERRILIRENKELGWKPKGDEEEWVPISEKLAAFLKEDLTARNSEEVWYLDKGNGTLIYGQEDALARAFSKIKKRLGIFGSKSLHGIRASVCIHLLEDGAELLLVHNCFATNHRKRPGNTISTPRISPYTVW